MSIPFVTFPSTAGNYITTDDVNLLGADTAHLYQGAGSWNLGVNGTLTRVDRAAAFGGKAMRLVTNGAGTARFAWSGGGALQPIAASVLQRISFDIVADAACQVSIVCGSYTSGIGWVGNYVFGSTVVLAAGVPVRYTAQGTPGATSALHDLTASIEAAGGGTPAANITVELWDSLSEQEASPVGSFLPSLSIDGTLFEEKFESGIPAVLAGGVLKVGESWSGDGYHYRRYDGADNTAPLVAQFAAADVVRMLP